jgi:hypothetical protein
MATPLVFISNSTNGDADGATLLEVLLAEAVGRRALRVVSE